MSERVKRCGCSQVNAEHEAFCVRCGQPIMDLVAVLLDAGTAVVAAVPVPAEVVPANPAPEGKKICPLCGVANESFALLCEGAGCGNDLSAVGVSGGVAPPPEKAPISASEPVSTAPKLFLLVGSQNFECRDNDVIGREGTVGCQVFSGIGTVSRRHVLLTCREEKWFITALAGVQNITQLDGRELPRGTPEPLVAEHHLRMSTQCSVRLRVGQGGNSEKNG
ncbi:MAG: hypothetical protein EBS05_25580 [Proteobacteria bacterium]|nr:hypothetical protein [Pseudomonadota bacterium]